MPADKPGVDCDRPETRAGVHVRARFFIYSRARKWNIPIQSAETNDLLNAKFCA